jgi:hypothetical protein
MFVLIALVSVWSAPALAQATGTRFHIPFNFQVGKERFPAGEYRLSVVSEKGLLIQQIEGNQSVVTMTKAPVEKPGKNGPAQLVFNRYGDKRFLSEAWLKNSSGRELPSSAEEREYARSAQHDKEVVFASNR